jgi:hypothetical protein
MKSNSELISAVETHPYPANLKEADSGRYVVCNASNARQLGMPDPESVVGLTIHDMRYARSGWGAPHAEAMAALDFRARDKKMSVSSRQAILDADGEARLEEVTKSPIMGHRRNVLGILSFQRDLTSSLALQDVYKLYRGFYKKPEAIRRMLAYLGIEGSFAVPPTEAPFKVLLGKIERLPSKEIARLLGISDRTVACHIEGLSNKTADGDLRRVLALARRKGI